MIKRKSFKGRIILFSILIMGFLVIFLSIASTFLLKEISLHITEDSLKAESQEILNDLIDENNGEKCELPDVRISNICISEETLKTYNPENKESVLVLIKGNKIIYSSLPEFPKNISFQSPTFQLKLKNNDYLFSTVRIKNSAILGVSLILGRNISDLKKTLNEFVLSISLLGIGVTFLGGLIIYRKLNSEFKYLEDLILKIESISEKNFGNYKINCGHQCPQEFKFLAKTFNNLMNRIFRLVENQKNFLSNAAHELKTPLTVILSQVEIALRRERKQEEYRKILENIKEEISQMTDTVKKLLILSRIELDKQKISFQKVDLKEVIKKSINLVTPLAEKENIKVSFKLQGDKSLKIKGDKTLLIQLFVNILENAIKYNIYGGNVNIDVKDTEQELIVSISDTGVGIPEEEINRVFEKFYTVKECDLKKPGTGIGLSIVKEIAELHHASLKIESKLNKGTTIYISFKKNL
nr:HAMP domain-containing sensor histidine kinase [Desulfurobacterium thermolithotrophum]